MIRLLACEFGPPEKSKVHDSAVAAMVEVVLVVVVVAVVVIEIEVEVEVVVVVVVASPQPVSLYLPPCFLHGFTTAWPLLNAQSAVTEKFHKLRSVS